MKNYILLLFCFVVVQNTYSQDDVDINQVRLAVKTPTEYVEDLKKIHLSKLSNKIERMITNYGVSSLDFVEDFMIYPEYEIYDSSVLQTGMGKIYSIEASLTLKIIDLKTMTLISTYTMELKGEDYGSKDKAITKSIGRIKTKSKGIEEFITSSKRKIINYYKVNCDKIYSKASTLLENGQVEKAVKLLRSVPENLTGSCYDKILRLEKEAIEIYKDKNCLKTIQEAEQAVKDENYAYASALLKEITERSKCYQEAQGLINQIDNKDKSKEESDKAVNKVKEYNKKVIQEVVVTESKKEERNLMCLTYGENCN